MVTITFLDKSSLVKEETEVFLVGKLGEQSGEQLNGAAGSRLSY